MADPITEYAKQGHWETYKSEIKKLWREYIQNDLAQGGDPTALNREAMLMLSNKLPIELWIEPELWNAAKGKADGEAPLKATIRLLLQRWVDGQIDPW